MIHLERSCHQLADPAPQSGRATAAAALALHHDARGGGAGPGIPASGRRADGGAGPARPWWRPRRPARPARRPTRSQRHRPSRHCPRGRPRPRVAQDLHQQQPGYLRRCPGESRRGPSRALAGVAELASVRARPVGSSLFAIGSSLRQRHCRGVRAMSLEALARARTVLLACRTVRSESCATVSLRALRGGVRLASRRYAAHDGTVEVSSGAEDHLAWP